MKYKRFLAFVCAYLMVFSSIGTASAADNEDDCVESVTPIITFFDGDMSGIPCPYSSSTALEGVYYCLGIDSTDIPFDTYDDEPVFRAWFFNSGVTPANISIRNDNPKNGPFILSPITIEPHKGITVEYNATGAMRRYVVINPVGGLQSTVTIHIRRASSLAELV